MLDKAVRMVKISGKGFVKIIEMKIIEIKRG